MAGGTVLATILSLYFVPAAFLVLRKPFLLTLLQRNSNADKRETDEEQQALVVNQ